MSRRLYHQMARSRATLNHGLQGISADVAEQAARESDAATVRARQHSAAIIRRVVHPVVDVPEGFEGYRVVRLFLVQGYRSEEPICATRVLDRAVAVCGEEQYRAQVLDALGRVKSDNWADMERR